MLIGEPPRTQGDLNFPLFGFPVRVHPFFWLIVLFLGMSSPDVISLVVWMVAVFVSILFHELGHAFAMRTYGLRPSITLYGFGGLTSPNYGGFHSARQPSPLGNVLISAAGPGAGFLLAAVVSGVVYLSGHELRVSVGWPYGILVSPAEIIYSMPMTMLVGQLLFINLLWGLVNLLPVYPLDGGHIVREILVAANPRQGIAQSLIVSMFTAGALAIVGVVQWHSLFVGLLFGYMAYTSFTTLQAYTGRGPW